MSMGFLWLLHVIFLQKSLNLFTYCTQYICINKSCLIGNISYIVFKKYPKLASIYNRRGKIWVKIWAKSVAMADIEIKNVYSAISIYTIQSHTDVSKFMIIFIHKNKLIIFWLTVEHSLHPYQVFIKPNRLKFRVQENPFVHISTSI